MSIQQQQQLVAKVIAELSKPENRDLLLAVVSHTGKDDSFMFTFSQPKRMDFDEFSAMTHLLDGQLPGLMTAMGVTDFQEDFRSMSERYDEYLVRLNDHRLNESQSARFSAAVDQFDDGWSGAYYGMMMRSVQSELHRMFNN